MIVCKSCGVEFRNNYLDPRNSGCPSCNKRLDGIGTNNDLLPNYGVNTWM